MLDHVQLGQSGLQVSRLCLGTMNFGEPGVGHQGGSSLAVSILICAASTRLLCCIVFCRSLSAA